MVVIRCPACRAENVQGSACRRCRADLSLMFALEERRAWALAEARRLLAAGRADEADGIADEANWLRSDEESRRLTAVTRVLRRDFAGAWERYQSAVRSAAV